MPCSLYSTVQRFQFLYRYGPRYGPTIRPPLPYHATLPRLKLNVTVHQHRLCLIARFLRRQLGLQQAHSPLQIHARVRIGDPLKVLFYLFHDLLQLLGGREVVVVWPGE
jgi:hypothetical protein